MCCCGFFHGEGGSGGGFVVNFSITCVCVCVCAAMHVLDGIQQDKDSGIVNYNDNLDGDSAVTNKRVLILLLEQEILFIELSLPE